MESENLFKGADVYYQANILFFEFNLNQDSRNSKNRTPKNYYYFLIFGTEILKDCRFKHVDKSVKNSKMKNSIFNKKNSYFRWKSIYLSVYKIKIFINKPTIRWLFRHGLLLFWWFGHIVEIYLWDLKIMIMYNCWKGDRSYWKKRNKWSFLRFDF